MEYLKVLLIWSRATLIEFVVVPADFPNEINPEEYLRIFLRIPYPQVILTFAEAFPAEDFGIFLPLCLRIFLRLCFFWFLPEIFKISF